MATSSGDKHRKRLKRWRNLCPKETRFLIDQVEVHLIPKLEAKGFSRVDYFSSSPEFEVPASEIELERVRGDTVDSISFNFEKYLTPRFQVHCHKRKIEPPHEFIRSCNLIRSQRQYYKFWGKPWGLPTRFWPNHMTVRTISFVGSALGQLVRFLESGDLGRNISKQHR